MIKKIPWLTPRIIFWAAVFFTTMVALIGRSLFAHTGIWNEGIAFSLPVPTPIVYLMSASILIGLVLWTSAAGPRSRTMGVSLGLIVGGGIANLADRVVNEGRVWDYIPFFGVGYFNLSDVAVVIGLSLMIYHMWRKHNVS